MTICASRKTVPTTAGDDQRLCQKRSTLLADMMPLSLHDLPRWHHLVTVGEMMSNERVSQCHEHPRATAKSGSALKTSQTPSTVDLHEWIIFHFTERIFIQNCSRWLFYLNPTLFRVGHPESMQIAVSPGRSCQFRGKIKTASAGQSAR